MSCFWTENAENTADSENTANSAPHSFGQKIESTLQLLFLDAEYNQHCTGALFLFNWGFLYSPVSSWFTAGLI